MTLPNFLGIGAQRCGTTWLHTQLRSHPDIYVPLQRKEIHFFDEYYDRGLDWYQGFFPPAAQASEYHAIGEITPKYLYDPAAPARIRDYIPECRFIAILRNPVDRAYSQYGLAVQYHNEKRSFQDYLAQEPNVFNRGLYGKQLKRYLEYFPVQNFLILIFEHTFNDPARTLCRIADFLSVDASRFDCCDPGRKVNSSYKVRFARSYVLARRLARYLRRRKDADWLVNTINALGVKQIFGSRGRIPPLGKDIRTELLSRYQVDIATLEDLLEENLSLWKR
jgi:hypothetical protein